MIFKMINGSKSRYVTLLHVVVLFILSIKFTGRSEGNFTCIESERQALLSFKQGLMNSDDTLFSWRNEGEDCCNWRGVKCSNLTNHIIELRLRGEPRLRGEIGLSLVKLSHLRYLDLSNNFFEDASIPNYIGSFTNLVYLNLSYNQFSGVIPPHLGNLSLLHTLDLQFLHNLQSPKSLGWLSRLSSLQHLDLSNTALHDASDWMEVINKLPHLKTLSLSYCKLPPPIFPSYPYTNISTSLSKLDLSRNFQLPSSIFLWLSNFSTTLVHLDLSYNTLQEYIPSSFGNMTSLSYIDFSYTQLKGENTSAKSLWNFCNLNSLVSRGNQIKGSFSDFLQILSSCAQNSLQYLDLSKNEFSGSLPDFSTFPNLKQLDLSFNQFSGTVPVSLGRLSFLETLSLGFNSLEGTILEAHFSNLTKLRSLDIGHNSLNFHPHSIWAPPPKLQHIYLSSCPLGPRFPNWLQRLNLSELDISDAGISDTIPEWFWKIFPNLILLDLSENKIRGELPSLPMNSTRKAGLIYLRSNEFEGQIPSFLSQVSMLDVSDNKFSGLNFLCEIDTISSLNILDVSNNQFLKGLPNCWVNLPYLFSLNLANNGFSGVIPSSFSNLTGLQRLYLGNNSFFGEIPSWLENFIGLVVLDLGGNNLSGLIPGWIGDKLSILQILNLKSNQLYGQLPSSLCYLHQVAFLDLSLNNITGGIPNCIHNLSALTGSLGFSLSPVYFRNQQSFAMTMTWKGTELIMEGSSLELLKSIDLSGNRLTGKIPDEIVELVELVSLNLSRNDLTGGIPEKIGQLKSLDVMDLSRNELIGHIPSSLSQINRLSVLDLSYNKLSGRIPTSTQLQSFSASAYLANPELCGPPLPRCLEEGTVPNTNNKEEEAYEHHEFGNRGFYISVALGFVVGFWGICGSLVFYRSWRHAYFQFLSDVNDWFYVKVRIHGNNILKLFKE